jgi:DNA-binding CsgD family transcriptional regulator
MGPLAPHESHRSLSGRLVRLIGRSVTPMLVGSGTGTAVEANEAMTRLIEDWPELETLIAETFASLSARDAQLGQWRLTTPGGEALEVEYCCSANMVPGYHLAICTPSAPAVRPGARMARPLTTRERQILELLALGSTGEQIAERLVLSPETVQKHVHNAKRKIGADTRAHMIALALTRRLIDPRLAP